MQPFVCSVFQLLLFQIAPLLRNINFSSLVCASYQLLLDLSHFGMLTHQLLLIVLVVLLKLLQLKHTGLQLLEPGCELLHLTLQALNLGFLALPAQEAGSRMLQRSGLTRL